MTVASPRKMASIQGEEQISEETPFLRPNGYKLGRFNLFAWRRDHKTAVKILVLFFGLFANFAGSTFVYPIFRLTQHVVCYEYVKRNGDQSDLPREYDAPICLSNEVQIRLANIIAYKAFFTVFPMLLTTMFYGKLADTWGRKPILLLNMVGEVFYAYWLPLVYYLIIKLDLNIDSRIIWVDAIVLFIGGGDAVIYGALHAMLSDVLDPDERFHYFSLFWALTLVPDAIAPPLGAWQSDINRWLPFIVGAPYILVALLIILMMPETLRKNRRPASTDSSRHDQPSSESTINHDQNHISEADETVSPKISRDFFKSIFRSRIWILLLTIVSLWIAIRLNDQHFKQYCLKVLGWSLQQASFMTSGMAIMSFLIGAIMLPMGHRWLRTTVKMHTGSADLILALFCLMLLVVSGVIRGTFVDSGWFIFGSLLTPSGQAAFPCLKSLGAPLFAENMQSQFFAITGIAQQVAGIAADPAAAALFSKGLDLGGRLRGMVFWGSAGVGVVTLLVLLGGYGGVVRRKAEQQQQRRLSLSEERLYDELPITEGPVHFADSFTD